MDTTIINNEAKEPGEKSPISEKFDSAYITETTTKKPAYKTLALPKNVITKLLDFQNNDLSTNTPPKPISLATSGVTSAQMRRDLSNMFSRNVPTSLVLQTVEYTDINNPPIPSRGAIKSTLE